MSVWVLGLDLWQVIVNGRVWTGTDGLFIADQMQYLAWIRDASVHGLASDLFVVGSTPQDYLQPAVEISGGLTALGMAPWLSLLLWKPVAVVTAFFAIRAFTRRMLSPRRAQRAALVIALFYGAIGDEWLPFWSWGYPFGLLAIAAMVGALLAYSRARERGAWSWWAPILGLGAAWLHPWQGEAMLLVVVGGEALNWWVRPAERGTGAILRRRIELFAGTVIATLMPLIYYAILDRADPVWRLGREASNHGWGLGPVLLSLVPLLLAASLAYRRRPQSFLTAATMIWPPAALVVYLVSETALGATPLHAFAGVSVPLAVLAVDGVLSVRWRIPQRRLVGTVVVALATIPGTVYMLSSASDFNSPSKSDANFINHDEQRALSFLAHDHQPGAVLTDFYMGMVVPAETGRHTYIGDYLWSVPHYQQRFFLTYRLFHWPWPWHRLHSFVLSTGARFVLSDCHTHAGHLDRKLKRITLAIHRFGCAAVYQIR